MHLSKLFHLPTPQHGAGWPFSERAQKEALTAPKGLLRAPKGFKETPALQVGFISPVLLSEGEVLMVHSGTDL